MRNILENTVFFPVWIFNRFFPMFVDATIVYNLKLEKRCLSKETLENRRKVDNFLNHQLSKL